MSTCIVDMLGHYSLSLSRPCGAMDNASDYGSEDSRFESWQGRSFCSCFSVFVGTFFALSSSKFRIF